MTLTSKKIDLDFPLTISGTSVSQLSMRCPTLDDQIRSQDSEKSTTLQEVRLFADLCEVPPDDLRRIAMPDYIKLQRVYRAFFPAESE